MSNTFSQVKKNTVQICTAKISQGTFTLARISTSGTKAHWTVLTQNACDWKDKLCCFAIEQWHKANLVKRKLAVDLGCKKKCKVNQEYWHGCAMLCIYDCQYGKSRPWKAWQKSLALSIQLLSRLRAFISQRRIFIQVSKILARTCSLGCDLNRPAVIQPLNLPSSHFLNLFRNLIVLFECICDPLLPALPVLPRLPHLNWLQ